MKFFKLDNGRYLGMEDTMPDQLISQIPELISNGLIDVSYEKTYGEEEYQLAVNPPEPTWENTLTCHQERSGRVELLQIASKLGYVYFAWNGSVFKVTNFHQNLTYEMVEDIYEIDIQSYLTST